MNKSYLNSVIKIISSSKPSTAIRLLLMVLFVSISPLVSFGQCSYPGTATSVGTYTFCIDNSNTITTVTVNAGKYALLNVVKGFNYTFSIGNVFGGVNNENLTVYDTSNTILTSNSGPSGCAISNWTSTISGQVKVLLSKGVCVNDNSTGGALTLTLNSLNNTQDIQTAYGIDSWIGHVYNYTGAMGTSPSTPQTNTNPFLTANYVGYYNEAESFYQEFSGGGAAVNNYCFPVLSNGTNLVNIDSDGFAVRYRMRSTKPAGCYIATFKSDDGVRLYVDNALKHDNWNNHAIQTTYAMIYLTGSSDLIYDYYENTGLSQVGFSMTSLSSLNTVTQPTQNVCTPSSSFIDGSSFSSYGFSAGTVTYQWKTSTSSTGPFVNCGGTSTNEDYTVSPAVVATAGTGNVTNYYKRVVTSNANAGCVYDSNVISITTSPSSPSTPGIITGSATQCAGNTLQTYSIAAVAKATSYNWTLPANWTITSGAGTNSITVSIASNGATNNVSVNAVNGCGISGSSSLWVAVSTPTVAGTVTPANTNVCSGSNSTNLSLSGNTGSIVRWESSIDNFAGGPITTIASTGSPITASNVTVDTYYRAVVQSGGCNVLNTSSVKLTVVGAMVSPGLISINGGAGIVSPTTNCASTTMTFSIAAVANATSYTWTVGTGWTIVSGQGTATVSVTTGTTAQSGNISVYATNGTCPQTSATYLWVTLTNTAPPTGTVSQSFCSGATVANLSATGTNIKWYTLSTGGSALASTTVLTNGTHYYASQNPSGCESTTRFDVLVTINSSLTITPNKVDEACPSSNNGTISPVLSGGLTNIRYIKLTQKYVDADAWQQVQEIQAVEILTGTNVALASNGATATSSSDYNNDVTNYGPQRAIDGDFISILNTGFWHSNSTNINEYILVDLKAAKNIDYLRFYNRNNCCQQRGQNMLLELFDASNNLVYSKTVDLFGGVYGAHYIDVNVLDVSWADGATTLNRTGLDSGTYTLNCADAVGCSTSSPIVISSSATNNTWNGTAWSQGGTPPATNGTQNLVFDADFTATTADLAGCSCTVNTGRNVTINSGRTLIITEGVTVSGTGTLTFDDTASLVQINDTAVNSGSITYKRKTSSVLNTDYTYWSSPVANQTLNISTTSYSAGTFYSYDDFASPEGWKKETAATIMKIGKGYIIRGTQNTFPPPPGLIDATFTGVPNNVILPIQIGPSGTSNLLGNPYPSAINADAFLSTNSALVEGTIYLWTHNTAIQSATNIGNNADGTPKAGSGVLAYTQDDYASYNGTGGAAASGGTIPNGKIAAGQAFFTTSKATGTSVTFNNAMRLSSGGAILDNSQFFKTKNTVKTTNAIEKDRIWLNMTNTEGAFKQTLIGYITDATNDYDSRFDGESFDGNEFVDFYSVNNDKNLVIQGRALPFDENDTVPLGFRSAIDGDFTIKIDQADGLLANQSVFIEDKLTNTIVDLKTGNYTFNTTAGTFNDRLVLRYSNKTLGTGDFEVANNKVVVSVKNKQIKINSVIEPIDKITIYDLSGKLIYQKKNISANEFLVADFISDHQTFIVKTILQNGTTVSDKVIY